MAYLTDMEQRTVEIRGSEVVVTGGGGSSRRTTFHPSHEEAIKAAAEIEEAQRVGMLATGASIRAAVSEGRPVVLPPPESAAAYGLTEEWLRAARNGDPLPDLDDHGSAPAAQPVEPATVAPVLEELVAEDVELVPEHIEPVPSPADSHPAPIEAEVTEFVDDTRRAHVRFQVGAPVTLHRFINDNAPHEFKLEAGEHLRYYKVEPGETLTIVDDDANTVLVYTPGA